MIIQIENLSSLNYWYIYVSQICELPTLSWYDLFSHKSHSDIQTDLESAWTLHGSSHFSFLHVKTANRCCISTLTPQLLWNRTDKDLLGFLHLSCLGRLKLFAFTFEIHIYRIIFITTVTFHSWGRAVPSSGWIAC